MKIQTFSIVAGSEACNARCPFCVSKMTPPHGVELKEPEVNWRNFRKACMFAKQSGTTTAMITGKGEPTLFPEQITKYLAHMEEFEFPFIELQTNGIQISEKKDKFNSYLDRWYDLGLTLIAISHVHYDPEKNREIYLPYRKEYINLPDLIKCLHEKKYSVRLATILLDGYIDNSSKLEKLINFAKENKVEQLKVTPVEKPKQSRENVKNGELPVFDYIKKHFLKQEQYNDIKSHIERNGTPLMNLVHGATIYDINDQNLCLSNCLTIDPNSENIRQLIFFPDGHLRFDWQYTGAILL